MTDRHRATAGFRVADGLLPSANRAKPVRVMVRAPVQVHLVRADRFAGDARRPCLQVPSVDGDRAFGADEEGTVFANAFGRVMDDLGAVRVDVGEVLGVLPVRWVYSVN